MPTVLNKKYSLPKRREINKEATVVVCPLCWHPECHVFLTADSRSVTSRKRESTGDFRYNNDPERSDFLRQWHATGIDLCDLCKRDRKVCDAAKDRHANRLNELEREAADAEVFVTKELLNAWKSATGDEKLRLQKEGKDAQCKMHKAARRAKRYAERQPCKRPIAKTLPQWYTEETAAKKPAGAPESKKATAPPPPIMQQYRDAKSQHPDMLLLFRMGDFYELFDTDARDARTVLGLTLTSRDGMDMVGFLHHQLESYLHKLLASGHRVAVCDQVDSADGSIERATREVAKVTTKVSNKPRLATTVIDTVATTEPAITKRDRSPAMPTAAYCDGGVIGSNPSTVGGTWAVVLLDEAGMPYSVSGVVTPDQAGLVAITNNYTELLAAVEAMERLPAGWTGMLYTDSNVTRCRIVNARPSMAGIPESLQHRLAAAKARLGWMAGEDHVVLLNGHPTKAELAAGVGKRGLPTSKWNVLCDRMCGDEAAKFKAEDGQ